MRYIDAYKLIAEIERLDKVSKETMRSPSGVGLEFAFGISAGYADVLKLIASLQQEQPEVVLTDDASFTKELKRFLSDTGNEKKGGGVILPIIKHFYSLGLNARKEEMK